MTPLPIRPLRIALLGAVLVTFAACDSADIDDEGPVTPQSIAGVWEGTITQPNPNISTRLFRLELTQVDRSVTGQAIWRYAVDNGGRVLVTASTGTVLGTVPTTGPITYTVSFPDLDPSRQFHEMTLQNGTLSGTWSANDRGSSGTSSLTRR